MTEIVRMFLRRRAWWVDFRALNREGWRSAWKRRRIQRAILSTPPVETDRAGDEEVRVLTWRRDWVNTVWALKTFYRFSGLRLPLCIHDGGLSPGNVAALRAHFPNAVFVPRAAADAEVESLMQSRNLSRCLEYRRRNPTTLKLFDFFLLSRARTVISIDADIVFFRRPAELLDGPCPPNRYNQDESYFYALSLDELERRFGFRPVSHLNSGLSRVARASVDFDAIERWLCDDDLFADRWVTEQTLHALASAAHPIELLPSRYLVSTKAGLEPQLVCKHYPSVGRPLLYAEGMRHLIDAGFCRQLCAEAGRP